MNDYFPKLKPRDPKAPDVQDKINQLRAEKPTPVPVPVPVPVAVKEKNEKKQKEPKTPKIPKAPKEHRPGNPYFRNFVLTLAFIIVLVAGAGIFVLSHTRTEKEKSLNGVMQKFYVFDKLLAERTFRGGHLTGPTTIYYLNGKVKSEMNFKDNLQDGPTKRYSPSGVLLYEDTYEAGTKTARNYYDKSGKVTSTQTFKAK